MKKLIGLTIGILLTIGIVSIGVWAYFSSTRTTLANTFTAGTLDIYPATYGTGPMFKYTTQPGGSGSNGNVVFNHIIPGDSFTITWVLNNNGSVPGTLSSDCSSMTFTAGPNNELAAAIPGNDTVGGDLDSYVGVKVQIGTGPDRTAAENAFSYVLGDTTYYMPLSAMQAALSQSVPIDGNGDDDTVVYKLSFNVANPLKAAGTDGRLGTGDDTPVNNNIIQGDGAAMDVHFTLTQ